jgi:manganese transport protein
MIPLPMIPLVLLTRKKGVMGELVNGNITTIGVFVGIILSFNSYLIATTIKP